jgi:hypothetical protein
VGINHGGNRIGRVMEAVDELEPQCNQQREPEKNERTMARP